MHQPIGYRPNEHAQRLKQGSDVAQNSIGIVTGGTGYNVLERSYYNTILSSLYDYTYQQHHQISFMVYWDALKDPVFFNKHIHEQKISSLVLMLPSLIRRTDEDEKLLKQTIARIPHIVCLEESLFDLPAVLFDRANAAKLAVSHLIGLGHRDIAFIAIDDQRLDGYKQTLFEHGIDYDEGKVDFLAPSLTHGESAYRIARRFFESGKSFSAMFTATDDAAIGVMASATDLGIHIPQDLALVSIDNIDIASIVRPALTTIDVPKRTLARLALQSLMTQRDFPDQRQASTLVPIELIIRDSCGSSPSLI